MDEPTYEELESMRDGSCDGCKGSPFSGCWEGCEDFREELENERKEIALIHKSYKYQEFNNYDLLIYKCGATERVTPGRVTGNSTVRWKFVTCEKCLEHCKPNKWIEPTLSSTSRMEKQQ